MLLTVADPKSCQNIISVFTCFANVTSLVTIAHQYLQRY